MPDSKIMPRSEDHIKNRYSAYCLIFTHSFKHVKFTCPCNNPWKFQGQKSWKHDFEITGDTKFPPGGSTFWSGFEAPVGQRPLSGPKKSKITNKAQNRDFSIPIDR